MPILGINNLVVVVGMFLALLLLLMMMTALIYQSKLFVVQISCIIQQCMRPEKVKKL